MKIGVFGVNVNNYVLSTNDQMGDNQASWQQVHVQKKPVNYREVPCMVEDHT